MKLRLKNYGYGEYGCSKCGAPLHGWYMVVSTEDDADEGMEWRSFCNSCEKVVKDCSDEQLYEKYPESPYLGE